MYAIREERYVLDVAGWTCISDVRDIEVLVGIGITWTDLVGMSLRVYVGLWRLKLVGWFG